MNNAVEASDADLLWYHTQCAEEGIAFNADDEFRFLEAVARKTADSTSDNDARNEAYSGD